MKQKVAIVTDSTACLSHDLAQARGIEVVPTEMYFDGRVYRDGVDPPTDFYTLLRTSKALPATSAPSPGRFLGAFAHAAQRAESVLCVTLPAELSSTHNSSQQAVALAREALPGMRIVTMPAPAVAAGQGLLVLETAEAAAGGAGLDQLVPLVNELAPKVHFFAALDSLHYLALGGHVPRVAGWVGDRVGLKPILTAHGARVERLSQARSKRAAVSKMLRMMETRNPLRRPIRGLVMHADALGEAERFRAEIEARFPCTMLLVTQFTPVMGAHSGPGVVGVAFRVLDQSP